MERERDNQNIQYDSKKRRNKKKRAKKRFIITLKHLISNNQILLNQYQKHISKGSIKS
jgi:hypothetical protein